MKHTHTLTLMLTSALVLALGALGGCSDDSSTPVDQGAHDAAQPDSASDTSVDQALDAAQETAPDQGGDAFTPLPGFGKLGGQCGVLDDTEWKSTQPFLFRNNLDLGSAAFDPAKLTAGGKTIFTEGNRGGSSLHSEIFSYEVLHRCELAKLLKTEGKVEYKDAGGKKTDLLTEIDARRIGVSVTRAYHYPPGAPYTDAEALALLNKKLADLPLSQSNAKPVDAWTRSVLHILAYDAQHADKVQSAWKTVGAAVKGDAILVLTVTDGKDDYIY
jgi:hypothetical protein